jgi:hypothetical protein
MNEYDFDNKIKKLPEYIIPEINDYIEFLLNKYGSNKKDKTKFKFDWEGSLSKLKNKYSSVELQHKSLDWR